VDLRGDGGKGCLWTWDENLDILQILIPNHAARVELTITPGR